MLQNDKNLLQLFLFIAVQIAANHFMRGKSLQLIKYIRIGGLTASGAAWGIEKT
jgi:hypothetical protein